MTTTTLATALTDCAADLYPLEAGVALLVVDLGMSLRPHLASYGMIYLW